MKQVLLMLLILLPINSHSEFNYRLAEGTKRKLAESQATITTTDWNPLRIHFEYLQTNFDTTSITFLSKVFDITSTFFQRYLLTRRSPDPITFQSNYPKTFYGFSISSELQAKSYDADLVQYRNIQIIFVNIENNSQKNYLAYCGPAVYDTTTLRPIMGLMSWNMYYTSLSTMTDASFEANLETAIHETTHGLGFVDDFFSKFYDSVTGNPYDSPASFTLNNIGYLTTPRITNYAKYHFNCSTTKGVAMENNGGSGTAGSHFERSLLYNEIMTGSDMTGNFVITDFTFEFYQDTGFYRLAEYSPDGTAWGKNKGCDFVEKYCTGTFSEFCTTDDVLGCSFSKTGQSVCMKEQLTDSCRYQYIYSNYDCRDAHSKGQSSDAETFQYFGYDSMCVTGSISKSQLLTEFSCYKFSCDANNKLTLYVDGQSFDCSKPGLVTIPSKYYGNLQCPSDSVTYCQNVDECQNQCSQKGVCLNKQCICMTGYSGKECTQTCTQYRYKDQCLPSCPAQTYAFEGIKYCVGCPGNCEICTNFNKCTTCNRGYQLRGGFCDNYELQLLIQTTSQTPIATSNSTDFQNNATSTNSQNNATSTNTTSSNNSTTNTTTSNTNSSSTNTNSTDSNTTTTQTSPTNSTANSTGIIDSNSTQIGNTTESTNSTSSQTNTSTSTGSIITKIGLIKLIKVMVLLIMLLV